MDLAVPSVQYGYLPEGFPLHRHEVWEMHLVTAGRGALLQGGRVWALEGRCLLLTPPRLDHSLTVDEPLSFYYLRFRADGTTEGILTRLVDAQAHRGPLMVSEEGLAEVERLKARLDSPSVDRVASGVHRFRSWLYDLAAGSGVEPSDGLDAVLAWIRANLDQRPTLDDLAGLAGLDRFTFSRRFRARTGLPPLAYLQRSKIEAAGFLLAGTSLSLAEVARNLGFCDEFHFGKVFRKWRGVPPGRWRRTSPGSSSP